jgi:mono/diheme cytochrome c family protein
MRPAVFAVTLGVTWLASLPVYAQSRTEPAGRAEAGQVVWRTGSINCKNCHGVSITLPPGTESMTHQDGEGGWGPDLAGGRGLSFTQFRRQVREPYGIMPAFTERQISDQTLADMYAYMLTLPPVKEPMAPRYPAAPPGSPKRQFIFATAPCINCHRPEMRDRRADLGAKATDVTFEYFKKVVYEHTSLFPDGNMGNFSRARYPEPWLREIYLWTTEDLGLRPLIRGVVQPRAGASANSYTMTIENAGVAGKGLAAEDLTISVVLPAWAKVENATGPGYQGIQRDEKRKLDVAVWRLPRLGPARKQQYTLTLSGTGPTDKLFAGSNVHWAKPNARERVPNLILKDDRIPDKGDSENITFQPPAQTAR